MRKTESESSTDVRQQRFSFMDMNEPRHSVYMEGLPISPSTNGLHKTVFQRGRTFRAKSQEYVDYTNVMKQHYLMNASIYIAALHLVSQWKKDGYTRFQLNATFYFEESRILCKDGSPKRLDLSNRIKSLEDVLFKLLNLDDKHIFKLFLEKEVVRKGKQESVTIELFPCDQ